MVNVSENVKELLEREIRNPCHCKIVFGIIDPNASGNASVTASNKSYLSVPQHIVSREVDTEYATLEDYLTPLNSTRPFPPLSGSALRSQGYMSEYMSSANKTFSSKPTMTIEFSQSINIIGLTFSFDVIGNEYPTSFTITTYLQGTQKEVLTVNPDSPTYQYEHNFLEHDKEVYSFVSTSQPYRRVRLSYIEFGLTKTFNTSSSNQRNNLISVNEEKEVSLVNKNLPTYNMDFEINNIYGDFDIDNPEGITTYLLENQSVIYYWGIENDDRSVNWIKGGELLTKSDVSADRTKLKIPCTDKLTKLENTYTKGMYSSTGKTLKTLAIEVLTDGGLTSDDYILDSSLENITTKSALPNTTHKACLQLIASAGRSMLYTDRDGKICIKPINTTVSQYELSLDKILSEPPTTSLINKMKGLKTSYYTYAEDKTASEIATLETTLNGTETLTISYDNSVGQSASITGGTIVSSTFYGRSCDIKVTASGNIKIVVSGKKLTETATVVEKTYSASGSIGESENVLISSYENAIAYLDFLANVIENRNVYECKFRGDPTVDVGDVVKAETKFTSDMPSTITKTVIDYKGSFDGNIKFVKQEV